MEMGDREPNLLRQFWLRGRYILDEDKYVGQEKANVLRDMMILNSKLHESGMTLPSTYHVLNTKLSHEYSAVMDSMDEQGLNNHQNSIMTLVEGKRNESEHWESKLSNETTLAFIQKLQKKQGNNMIKIDFTKPIMEKTSSKENESVGYSSTIRERKPSQHRHTSVDSSSIISSRITPSFGKRKFTEESSNNPPAKSREISYKARQAELPLHRKSITSHAPRDDIYMKGQDSNDQKPDIRNSFLTAGEQLVINEKKNGKIGRDSYITSNSYGGGKKSLGTRRGVHGKFIPPVSQEKDDSSRKAYGGNNNNSNSRANDEIKAKYEEYEWMKNIDGKMIELIENEIMDNGTKINWDDIAGLEFAKSTIQEIVIWPMLRPDIFTGLRGPPKGLLLFGPPGTGKTLIGKCIASQSRATFFSISASSLTSKWVGEGEKMVRALFGVARCHQPAVVFIDEIDSLLTQRSDNEHESSRRIKTEFLVQLDGASCTADERILIVGATNRPQELDEAARRRLVKRLYIPLPESAARKQIVYKLMQKQSNSLTDSDLQLITGRTNGYSGADMANLCREAALGPIRSIRDIYNINADEVRPVSIEDFEKAIKHVRPSVSKDDLITYIQWNQMYGSGTLS